RDSKFVAEPLIYALRFPARAFYFTISLVGFCSAMIVASLALLGLQLFLLIPRAMIPIRALWKLLERVFGRRGWKCPFQRIGIFVPVIVLGHALPVEQRIDDDAEEEDERGEGQIGAQRTDIVPIRELDRVIDIAARHPLTAKEMLREEGDIRPDEHHPEM